MPQQICDAIVESLGYDNGVIWLHDEDKQVLRGAALHTKDSPWLIERVEGIIGQRIIGLEIPAQRDYSLAVRKILNGELYLTHSLYELATPLFDEATCSAIQQLIGAKTFINIPMLTKGKVVGDLLVTTSRDEATEREIGSLTAFANQAGIAIENIRLYRKLEQAYQELEATQRELIALQRATASIQTTLELDQILQQIVDSITEETIYNSSAIFLLDRDEGAFRLAAIAPKARVLAQVEKILSYRPAELTIPADKEYSKAVRRILGRQVIITHDLYELAAPRLSQATCSALQETSRTKTIAVVPMIAKGKVMGGLLVTTQQEAISKGRIESLVSFANQAASVLENARLLDIERKEQQRSALLLAISHEFKVPLTSIKTMGSLLAEELEGDALSPQAKMVDNIRRSVNKMERRLNELLDFARMQTATAELQLQPTSVKVAIEGAVSLCLPFTLSKKQTLTVEVPDSLPRAILDRLQFERIITNLLTNASKFTPEGGTIKLQATAEDDRLVVQVSDSGVGISNSELGRIFEPYYRGKASEPSSLGLGLGLAIARKIVELHHGKIWVESKPDKGSTFTFFLPLRNIKNAKTREKAKESNESSSNRG